MNVIYMPRIYEQDHVGVLFVTISDSNLGQNNRKLENRRSWNVTDIHMWTEMISKNYELFGKYKLQQIFFS